MNLSIFHNKKVPYCTAILVIMNIVYFIFLYTQGAIDDMTGTLMTKFGAQNGYYISHYQEYYRFFTSLFIHFSFEHLFMNMVILVFIGLMLENEIGPWKFALCYLISGIAANIFSYLYFLNSTPNVVSAGASGAVFGVTGTLLYVVLRNKDRISGVSMRQLILIIVFNIYNGFRNTGIDNIAHIGGLAVGIIMGLLLYHHSNRRTSSESF